MIYVSGPITLPNPMANTHTAIQVASRLMRLGLTPFVPHLSILWETVIPEAYDDWISYDLRIIKKCDLLIRIPGPSKGADIEWNFAKENGIQRLIVSTDPVVAVCEVVDYLAKGRS